MGNRLGADKERLHDIVGLVPVVGGVDGHACHGFLVAPSAGVSGRFSEAQEDESKGVGCHNQFSAGVPGRELPVQVGTRAGVPGCDSGVIGLTAVACHSFQPGNSKGDCDAQAVVGAKPANAAHDSAIAAGWAMFCQHFRLGDSAGVPGRELPPTGPRPGVPGRGSIAIEVAVSSLTTASWCDTDIVADDGTTKSGAKNDASRPCGEALPFAGGGVPGVETSPTGPDMAPSHWLPTPWEPGCEDGRLARHELLRLGDCAEGVCGVAVEGVCNCCDERSETIGADRGPRETDAVGPLASATATAAKGSAPCWA